MILNVICKDISEAAGGHPGSVDKIPVGLDTVYNRRDGIMARSERLEFREGTDGPKEYIGV